MALFLGGLHCYMAVCQNLVPLVNIKIAGKWMFIPLKMVLIGIDPYPHQHVSRRWGWGSSCSASAAQLEPQLFGRCFWMSGCHPNLGMSSSNGTSKKLAKDGLKMSQRCQIFSRNPHESSSSLELSDQKSWNHGELGTEAPEVSLPRTGPSLRDSGHFWVCVLSPSVLGCPILTYIYIETKKTNLWGWVRSYCMSLLCCRLGELAKGHCLQSFCMRHGFDLQLTWHWQGSCCHPIWGLSCQEKGIRGSVKKGPQQIDGWL